MLYFCMTDMTGVFQGQTAFNQGAIEGWDTASVTTMDSLFRATTDFNQGAIGGWEGHAYAARHSQPCH